mmetsp:Transcript_21106/g.66350  ORF Transcript_21106/g.66350 Transcript_21106/m.66350 type:complete len:567 (+) Transcript_21106:55-1755(+)
MNPNAPVFSLNPSAGEFNPSELNPPEPEAEVESWEEEDPLWQVTLRLADGDRARALEMLDDPDSLMQRPEVRAVMEGGPAACAEEEVVVVKAEEPPPPPVEAAEEPREEEEAPEAAKEEEEEDSREHLNLVFIGHVDAGKSTLSGNILYLTDHVDKRTIEKYEREAKSRNRESWFLAFIMDTNEEERAKGKTVEVGRAPFATAAKRYTVLDAPGHKNYVPHMIAGAAQADVGILVISARRGEFETGFERGGQTREHAMLAKTLGVRFLIVVVNKMDDPTVQWSKDRYEECVGKLKPFLKSCGYTIKREVKFLAISGLTGANVKEEVSETQCDWWRGYWKQKAHNTAEPTLLSCLDNLVVSGRSSDAPLRVPVLDRFHDRGTIAMGKVETGRLSKGDEILVMPTNQRTRVDAIFVDETKSVRSAKPGENVWVKLASLGTEDLGKGFVLCNPAAPCPAVTSFTAQIALVELLDHRPVFTAGYDCMFHAHTLDTECTVTELIDDGSANRSRRVRFAKQGAVVQARLAVPQSICLEAFVQFEQLGRFTLRDEGKSIAIGKVLALDLPAPA